MTAAFRPVNKAQVAAAMLPKPTLQDNIAIVLRGAIFVFALIYLWTSFLATNYSAKYGFLLSTDPHERRLQEKAFPGEATHHLQLRLMHRDSPNSPFRKKYSSRLEAVEDARALDLARLQAFQKRPSWTQEKDFRSTVKSGAVVGAGQYFVEFFIGTPPQRLMLIADTGSDLIWVRCSACYRCGNSEQPLFSSKASSSYAPIPCLSQECLRVPSPPQFSCNFRIPSTCRYDYVYADRSETSGVFSLETVTLNSTDGESTRIPNVAFGCGQKNTGQSFMGSGGVLGLGRGSISFASQVGSLAGHKFSYCLPDFFRTPPEDCYLTFGDGKHSGLKVDRPFQYTPLQRNPASPSLYYVGIEEVRVNGRPLPVPSYVWEIDAAGNGGTVIDSGTTLTFFLEPAYRTILRAMRAALIYPRVLPPSATFDLCFNSSGISDLELPQLVIALQGNSSFAPLPKSYFIDVIDGVRCLGLQGVESPFGFSILGNLLQQDFQVEYDRDNWRLGFAPTTCTLAG